MQSIPSSAGNNRFSFVIVANIVPGTILLPIGLLTSGWAIQERVFWLVPDIVSDLDHLFLTEMLRDIYRALRWLGLGLL
jgi:hypothetical protein